MPLVVTLSGPENTRAKTEVALEDAGLTIFPPDHYAVGRTSYDSDDWGHLPPLPSGDTPKQKHGFIAVLARDAEDLNRAVRVVEPHKWVLRLHYHLLEPVPDPVSSVMQRLAVLEARVGVS